VRMYHGDEAVNQAHQAKEIDIGSGEMPLAMVLKRFYLANSMSAAKALIDQGAVEVNNQVIKDWNYLIKKGDSVKVGKGKFIEIK